MAALDRRQGDAFRVAWPIGLGRKHFGGVLHRLLELGVRRHLVDEPPLHRACALDTLLDGAERIRQIAPHLALVGHAREAAGARQHGQQRQLGQRHGGAAVVGQQDAIGCQCQLVAAAGGSAADRAQILLAAGGARILHRVAGLVGELAEVDLVGMRRAGEHADIGAGAEHAVLAGLEHHHLHLGVLEAQPLHGVGELNVDAQVVGIELELIALEQAGVLVDVHDQLGRVAGEGKSPVAIARRLGLEIDACWHGPPPPDRRRMLSTAPRPHHLQPPQCIIIPYA